MPDTNTLRNEQSLSLTNEQINALLGQLVIQQADAIEQALREDRNYCDIAFEGVPIIVSDLREFYSQPETNGF